MRKAILNSAVGAIALMLASCSADEQVAQNAFDGAISYTVVADNQTRAANSYCNNNPPEEFRVWATHSKQETEGVFYINGDRIVKEGSGNTYFDADGTRFWPKEGELSFYAVVDGAFPKDVNTGKPILFDNTSKKFVVKDYTIADEIGKQLDLMYAVNKNVARSTSEPTETPEVELNFRHALSQICFKAKNENPKLNIIINKITVTNVNNKGDYTLPDENTNVKFENHDGTEIASTSGHGNWSNLSKTTTDGPTYTIDLGNVSVPFGTNSHNLTYDGNANHTTFANVLNLLPQKTENVNITIVFTAQNINSDGSSTETEVTEEKHSLNVNVDWKEGIRYIYTLIFPADYNSTKSIKYIVTTDDFEQEEMDPVINGHDAVLMRKAEGSEPALYFATKDINANNPYDYGDFFWWGDIDGHTVGDGFDFKGDVSKVETYGLTDEELIDKGWLTKPNDGRYLTPDRDAAYQKWKGTWRMPTKKDFEWLINENNCEWSWVDKSPENPAGFKVVSRTTKGTIFLPAAGYINDQKWHQSTPTPGIASGYYWTSEPATKGYNNNATRLKISYTTDNKIKFDLSGNGYRYDGFPIRPVANSTE